MAELVDRLQDVSLTNMSGRSRISCGAHSLRKDQLADERWTKEAQRRPDRFWHAAEQLEPIEASHQRWDV